MGSNIYQGQLRGPFEANEELFDLIIQECVSKPQYILHLGIQTDTDRRTIVNINNCGKNQEIEIGKTGIYEIGNTKIYSIKFQDDKDNNTIIDYTVTL